MKIYIYTFMTALALLLNACASTNSDPAEAYKGESASQIFNAGEAALKDNNYNEAIKRFEALDAQYPYGQHTELSQLHIIYAYYMSSDYLSAEAAADRFIHAHPANIHVDYAYYMRGLANYYQNMGVFERLFTVDFATRDLTQIKKSFNDFSELTHRFPSSKYAAAAHQYMVYLRNVLANHQLEVAQYYYSRQAYIASANRAAVVIQSYQGSPAVPQALVVMIKSYHQLGQKQLENQALQVLRYNYPDSSYLADALNDNAMPAAVMKQPDQQAELPVQNNKTAEIVPPVESKSLAMPYRNGNRAANPVTLGTMLDSVDESSFFTLHKKARVDAVASSSKEQAIVKAQVNDHTPPAIPDDRSIPAVTMTKPTQVDATPYRSNGLR